MLVRELMERLAELPPDVPVFARLHLDYVVEVREAILGGRQLGVGVFLVLDEQDLGASYSDYLENYLSMVREYSEPVQP
jgi:hypothetical protein